MKKIFATLLCLILSVIVFAGCDPDQSGNGGNGTVNAPAGVPDYESSKGLLRFDFTGYGMGSSFEGDTVVEDRIKYIADAGFTGMYLDPWSGQGLNTEKLNTVLELFEKYNISAYISLNNGWETRGNGKQLGGEQNKWKRLESVAVDYTQFPAFKGFLIFDEPGGTYGNGEKDNDFDFLLEEYGYWKSMWDEGGIFKNGSYKDYMFMVNGCGDIINVYEPLAQRIYPVIEDNLIITMDNYPFNFDTVKNQAYLSDTWLLNNEIFAVYARDNKLPYWGYAQSTDLGKSGRSAENGNFMLTAADIRFQNNTFLAFGARGVQYFTYSTSASYIGLIDNSVRTEAYYYIQQVNKEMQDFAHVFLNFNWQGLIPVVGSKNSLGYNDAFSYMSACVLESSARVKSIEATRDTLFSCFKDKDGYDGYLIVNYNDPYYKKTDDVSVTFNNATKALVYKNGVGKLETLSGGKYNVKLGHGEAVFVIPVV